MKQALFELEWDEEEGPTQRSVRPLKPPRRSSRSGWLVITGEGHPRISIPGEPPTLENARNLLRGLFFDPKRYDLTKVGRYKLNQRLEVPVSEEIRVLTTQDILA